MNTHIKGGNPKISPNENRMIINDHIRLSERDSSLIEKGYSAENVQIQKLTSPLLSANSSAIIWDLLYSGNASIAASLYTSSSFKIVLISTQGHKMQGENQSARQPISEREARNQQLNHRSRKRGRRRFNQSPLETYLISPAGAFNRNHLAISFFCLSLSSGSWDSSSAILSLCVCLISLPTSLLVCVSFVWTLCNKERGLKPFQRGRERTNLVNWN